MAMTIKELKVLNKAIKNLANNGHDIWIKDAHWEGYGFKLISDTYYIDVWVSLEHEEPNKYYIRKYKKDGNILDTFANTLLDSQVTTEVEKVEDIIREML